MSELSNRTLKFKHFALASNHGSRRICRVKRAVESKRGGVAQGRETCAGAAFDLVVETLLTRE
jgi:hypothetical protein